MKWDHITIIRKNYHIILKQVLTNSAIPTKFTLAFMAKPSQIMFNLEATKEILHKSNTQLSRTGLFNSYHIND